MISQAGKLLYPTAVGQTAISGMLFTILSLDGIVPQAISQSLEGQTQHGIAKAGLTKGTEKAFFFSHVFACMFSHMEFINKSQIVTAKGKELC